MLALHRPLPKVDHVSSAPLSEPPSEVFIFGRNSNKVDNTGASEHALIQATLQRFLAVQDTVLNKAPACI